MRSARVVYDDLKTNPSSLESPSVKMLQPVLYYVRDLEQYNTMMYVNGVHNSGIILFVYFSSMTLVMASGRRYCCLCAG